MDHDPRAGGSTPERRVRRDRPVRARPERDRLDIPRYPGRSFRPRYDPELFGRFAEGFARFMG
ncbi:MAG: DUF1003 domain-containing protein, partial [Actinopolymorphaceae bacterium]